METIIQNIQRLQETKEAIKQALTNRGVSVSNSDTFYSYAEKIANIQAKVFAGVYIVDTKGNFYTSNEWDITNNDEAVGVAVIFYRKFIIDKSNTATDLRWAWDNNTSVSGATSYSGSYNTDKIIEQLGASRVPAANYCRSKSISMAGKTMYGYLPARAEWLEAYDNKKEVNACMSLIGGTEIAIDKYHWSSNQDAINTAWCVNWNNGDDKSYQKSGTLPYCRPFYSII